MKMRGSGSGGILLAGGNRGNSGSKGTIANQILETIHSEIKDYDFKKIDFSYIPANRSSTPEEVSGAVTFLCSDQASYITGQTININGGLLFS